ncbi:hypothetical protein [Curtobacterium sp. GD1]|uniref:hypothetical protein n=1 Tax=Curtobacterium sp. GD1 TaxID=2810612 RepID=UPI001E35D939|nr:hypothetical protein [Curtobacterium sp. GD1]MCC8907387.1 hypothetical protein [Curtobacterium sp. GD1]
MEYEAERWVQRLRDGVAPPRWSLVVTVVLLVVIGGGALMLELPHLDWFTSGRHRLSLLLLPVVLLAWGLWVAFGSRSSGRRDRRALAHIRARGPVRFHLPVRPAGDEAPQIWTVHDHGFSAWTPDRVDPVDALSWHDVERIDLVTEERRGQRVDVAIRISQVDGGWLVLLPRTALGRPYPARQVKLDVLMRVLRSLRREPAR